MITPPRRHRPDHACVPAQCADFYSKAARALEDTKWKKEARELYAKAVEMLVPADMPTVRHEIAVPRELALCYWSSFSRRRTISCRWRWWS